MKKAKPARAAIIKHRQNYSNESGPANALAYLVRVNEEEHAEYEATGELFGGLYSIGVSLHLLASKDAKRLLAEGGERSFEDTVLSGPTVTLTAALGEPVLRNYLRHLLVDLFGWCGQIDGMIDCLVLMHNRRRVMPIEWSTEHLESWWEI